MTIDPQGVAFILAVGSGVGSGITAEVTRRTAGPGVPSVRGALMHAILACVGIVGATVAALFHQDLTAVFASVSAIANVGMCLLTAPSADPSQSRIQPKTETGSHEETETAATS